MRDASAEFEGVKSLQQNAQLLKDQGKPVVFMPGCKFRAAGKIEQMDLLLYPSAHTGYVTRLFFARKLEGAGASANWKQFTILDRSWWAPSWKDVFENQPWTSMVAAHLRAVE